ncbi:MAG: hypothetical protein WC866_03705 [Patescibacteria group bacterium]|jgi:hypothetical protein
MLVFRDTFDLRDVLERTRVVGYAFVASAITEDLRAALVEELSRLPLEVGDHERYPINQDSPNQVRQLHERAYRPLGHEDVPIGSELCRALTELVTPLLHEYPELQGWQPSEIGYQRYRDTHDRISPHRDRVSDQTLSVTFTLFGSAHVRVHAPETNPPRYDRLREIDAFLTEPGTAMFLRAPGFGNGVQIIHEVDPPLVAPRGILNLRKRETILKPPSETRWR